MGVGQRRVAIGLASTILAAAAAVSSGSWIGPLVACIAFVTGWLVMKVLLRRGAVGAGAGTSAASLAAVLGIAIDTILLSASSAFDRGGPDIIGSALLAFLAGYVLSLRFSSFGDASVRM